MLALQAEVGQIHQAISADTRVSVKLQVVRVSLTKLRSLGYDTAKLSDKSTTKSDVDQAGDKASTLTALNDGRGAQRFLDTLYKDHLATALEKKSLLVRSGETGTFHIRGRGRIGDEIQTAKPLPHDYSSVATTCPCGNALELTPEVLGDKVRLSFQGQRTQPDLERRGDQDAMLGVLVPEYAICIEAKSGETAVIAFPTQTLSETHNVGLPWISEIPYVGALFRRTEDARNEIATFVVVQPEIVESSAATATRSTVGSPR